MTKRPLLWQYGLGSAFRTLWNMIRCLQPFKLGSMFVECALAEECPWLHLVGCCIFTHHMAYFRIHSTHKVAFSEEVWEFYSVGSRSHTKGGRGYLLSPEP